MKRDKWVELTFRLVVTLSAVILLVMAGNELYTVVWGTRDWAGKFTLTWGLPLGGMILFAAIAFGWGMLALWVPQRVAGFNAWFTRQRDRLGWFRWPLMLVLALLPAKILLYTPLGTKFPGTPFRLALFLSVAGTVALLVGSSRHGVLSWRGVLLSTLLVGTVFLFARAFVNVTDYPLSLSWSEGNRIWDYSVLYGRKLYDYPPDKTLEAHIDPGRQSLWGLPFLLPQVSIQGVRLWSALVLTVPYALFGWMVFRPLGKDLKKWLWVGLWALLFINQGPIYTPLVLSAILVAGARRKPLWLALPLVYLAGQYAQMSRLTWMVAPAMWAAMVALVEGVELKDGRLTIRDWLRAAAFGVAGFMGGFGLSRGWKRLSKYFGRVSESAASTPVLGEGATGAPPLVDSSDAVEVVSSSGANSFLSDQPLLWERLWPNPTYGLGIVLGLLLAVGPLILLTVYLVRARRWRLNNWQQIGVFAPLFAFLVVGLVISVKIGGGSNLHNLDMFLIGLLFAAALAWDAGGKELLDYLETQPLGLRVLVLLIVAIPAFHPLVGAYPLELPPAEKVEWTLEVIQSEAARARMEGGEVLFMDQRQLLTFGLVGKVPLVAEYEKKFVMDKALAGDAAYFDGFYQDLAANRFAVIIAEPQRVRYADETEDWGAENDAWVQWVTEPLLCYYEPKFTIKKTHVWLFVPRAEPLDCSFP